MKSSEGYKCGPLSFALTEGRLVLLQSGRPEADYDAEEARALCKANDPNGCYDVEDDCVPDSDPLPLSVCVDVLNQWCAEDADTGRLLAAWLDNDSETFQALTGRPTWAGR